MSERLVGPLAVSLLAGFLNVSVSLYLERPPELEAASVAVQVASLSVLFCLLLYATVRMGLAVVSWLLGQLGARAAVVAGAVSPGGASGAISPAASTSSYLKGPATSLVVLTLSILTPFALLADRGGWQQDLVRFGFLAIAAILAAALGYLASRLRPGMGAGAGAGTVARTGAGAGEGGDALLMAAPLLGALVFSTTWWTAFAADLSATERYLLWVASAVLMALALGVCWALRTRVSVQWFGFGFAALWFVVAAFIVWSTNAPLELSPFDALSGERPRHVVLLTVDTLRADALGPRAGAISSTPNMDALSADSVVFDNGRSPAPWTKPAVVSMLTGLSPVVHEIMRGPTLVPDELVTLAEMLQGAGYRTGAVGENPFLHARYNFDQGFERYRMYPKMLGRSFGGRLVRYLGTAYPSTADLTDMAIEWVQTNADDPFFLWLHYFDPHPPYAPPAEYLTISGPASIGRSFGDTSGVRAGAVNLDAEEREWVEELYMGEVRYVDDNVGRFLDYLKSSGLYDDSLIIFSSDHGEEFWEHGGFEHGHSLYDEVIKVPLMVKLPGLTASGHRQSNVSTESILPTILDLLGVEVGDAAFSATSLSWAWRPDGTDPMTPIVSTGLRYFEDRIAVVRGPMKNIHWLVSGADELFDLDEDPGETTSLARENPELIGEAHQLIAAHKALSLRIRQLLGLPAAGEGVLDPAVLEQLRALGYIQ